jgi:hypothetical protein
MNYRRPLAALPLSGLVIAAACSGSSGGSGFGGSGSGSGSSSGVMVLGTGQGSGTGMMLNAPDATIGSPDAHLIIGDPTTCAEAASSKSYVGCDYWPTVTANLVDSLFDFTAVVANTQSVAATVNVTGPSGFSMQGINVPANGLTKVYLPWVQALKGPDVSNPNPIMTNSVGVPGGAYHLTSSVPVTVYQFNALEYQGMGGPPGKSWSNCFIPPGSGGCFSYSNDASVLLPTTAMTGNYRVTGEHGSSELMSGGFMAITATANNTMVTVTLSPTAIVMASTGGSPAIAQTGANKLLSFPMNAGDVVQLMGEGNDQVDLSGSLVYATNPVQVIAGRQCANQPDPIAACDHLESSVLPAETLGKDYVVTAPTSPHAAVIGHKVRFFGNVNSTHLTYSPSQPPTCPSIINAGEVVECLSNPNCATGVANDGTDSPVQVSCVPTSFEVTGDHEFAVSSFMLGGSAVDPNDPATSEGDPSMSPMVAVEQYRSRYIFLAPTDYSESYADVVVPTGDAVTLDGVVVSAAPTPLNSTWSILRVALAGGMDGAHLMTAPHPFGVQVIGYGSYTSYQYPAGLDLAQIAPPPPPPPGAK